MSKKVTIIALAALLLLTAAGPALAVDLPGVQYFTLVGIIMSDTLDEGGSTITVRVYHGNRFIQQNGLLGLPLIVQVEEGAEFRLYTPAGCIPTDPSSVEEGKTVSIHGMVVGGEFYGDRITVGVPLDCCTP
jgi:hypothetical protein